MGVFQCGAVNKPQGSNRWVLDAMELKGAACGTCTRIIYGAVVSSNASRILGGRQGVANSFRGSNWWVLEKACLVAEANDCTDANDADGGALGNPDWLW